jgi:hypothetical protein
MTTAHTDRSVSRRAALAGLGAGGLGIASVAFASQNIPTSAVAHSAESTPDLGQHPIVGTWLVDTPGSPGVATFGADGSTSGIGAPSSLDAASSNVVLSSGGMGIWEPTSASGIQFTTVVMMSDLEGAYAGSLTFTAHPTVSEDGLTFYDNEPQHVIIRDARNVIVFDETTPGIGVTGTRIRQDNVVFPESDATATPAT